MLLADEQVDWSDSDADGEVLWALADHLGSVRDVVDNAGTVRLHRSFDSFGNVVSETHYNAGGATVTEGQAGYVTVDFAYTGKFFDESTGLQNNWHRWYDARNGQWVSEDPIDFESGDANKYRYVGNGPTTYHDPMGLERRRFTPDEQNFITRVIVALLIPPEDNPSVVKERREKALDELYETCGKVNLVDGPRNGLAQVALGPGNAIAVTINRNIYFDPDFYPSPVDGRKVTLGDRREIEKLVLLAHEFTHVMQYERFPRFLESYACQGLVKDYANITWEREAYSIGDAVRDLLRRDGSAYGRKFTDEDIRFLKDRYEFHKNRRENELK